MEEKHVEFYSKNKFEKLVHLVGFIIRIFHDARSIESIKKLPSQIIVSLIEYFIYGFLITFTSIRAIPFILPANRQRDSVDKKNQLDVTFCILYFSYNSCSTCFGQTCAHHQELTTA